MRVDMSPQQVTGVVEFENATTGRRGSIYVSKQKPDAISGPGDRRKNDSGAPQIEVTPEMIEAGALALTCFDWVECDPREAAKDVFIAMLEASRTSQASR